MKQVDRILSPDQEAHIDLVDTYHSEEYGNPDLDYRYKGETF